MPIQVAGEGWIGDLYDWFPSPQWMQVYNNRTFAPSDTALPTIVPESVQTAEVCFRKPDGWSVCVPLGIWAQSYRNQGYPEILGSAPEFIPPIVAEVAGPQGPVVVPSDASAEIPGDAETVSIHGEGGWLDWGLGAVQDWLNPAVTPIYNFAGAPSTLPPAAGVPHVNGATCGQSPCVCGVDSCGRPALIDPRTGKRCYKRRRKRLLTEGDFNDLMRIATLPNTKNVSVALAKAVGRR